MKSIVARLLVFLALPLGVLNAGSSDARLAYEKALALEEASGRLNEAIALFQKVIAQGAADEALAAQAQLHVGICYEKLARKEARQAYQAVLDKYPAQQEAVRLARERLTRLAAATAPPRGITVREFSLGSPKRKTPLEPEMDPAAFVASRDGTTLVYTDWVTGDLAVHDLARESVQGLYDVDWMHSTDYYMSPVLSPDGRRVAFHQASYPKDRDWKAILGVDSVRGGSYEAAFETKTSIIPLDWSPDGGAILAALEGEDRSISLVAVSPRDKKLRRLVTLNWEYPVRAEYSPDGRWIAYDSSKDGERKIYLLSVDGLVERVLVDSPRADDSPVWSGDGRFLIFRSNRAGDWDLFALPVKDGAAAGEPILVKSNIGELSSLRGITRDGKLFYSEQVAGPEIALLERGDPKGVAGARIVPKLGTREHRRPIFSPDGQRLAYLAGPTYGPAGNQILRIASLDGTILHELRIGPEFSFRRVRRSAFSPDGRTIALAAEDRRREGVILLVSAETGKLVKTIPSAGFVTGVGWSRDAQAVYAVIGQTKRRLERIEVASGRVTGSKELPGTNTTDARNSVVSPDGRLLALLVAAPREGSDGKHELVIHSIEDGTERAFPLDTWIYPLVWDFDSKHVFFNKPGRPWPMFRLSIETGDTEIFLKDSAPFHVNDVSSDGKLLAMTSMERKWRIWTVENFLPAKSTATAAR